MHAYRTLVVTLVIGVAACGNDGDAEVPAPEITAAAITERAAADSPTTGAATAISLPASTFTEPPVETVPDILAGYTETTIRVGGQELRAVIADTSALRSRGLMGVADLGPVDGMFFVWMTDTERMFWMKDTLITLDIAWFDWDGRLVSTLTMTPCGDEGPCPRYGASGPYRYALEMPEGTMPALVADSILEFGNGF